MSNDPTPPDALPGIGLDFIHRVYRTSLILVLLGALFIWERFRAPAALGWLIGSLLSLAMLASLEWSIRRFIKPGSTAQPLVGLSLLKVPLAGIVLILVFLAAKRGWVNPFWLLPGFALPHAVVALKFLGRKLLELRT